MNRKKFPGVGDLAPAFEAQTTQGTIHFPEYSAGQWCIIFAHPANFTSAWRMYSNFLELKERWLNERNTKLLALSNEPIRQNDWSDVVRRYIGIFLKAPVIEDPDYKIAALYGMASGRRITAPNDRILYIIDPKGVIRMILHRPLVSIQKAINDLEAELDRLQGNLQEENTPKPPSPQVLVDALDVPEAATGYKHKPAYFQRNKLILN